MKYLRIFLTCVIFVLKKLCALIASIILLMALGTAVFLIIMLELAIMLLPLYGFITPTLLAVATKKPLTSSLLVYWQFIIDFFTNSANRATLTTSKKVMNLLVTKKEYFAVYPAIMYLLITLFVFLTIIFVCKIIGFSTFNRAKEFIIGIARKITILIVFLWKI